MIDASKMRTAPGGRNFAEIKSEAFDMKRRHAFLIAVLALALSLCLSACRGDLNIRKDEPQDEKPVIYLYPEEETDVSVKLDYRGELSVTYPSYGDGWSVTAYPDGTIINRADGAEYSYLFWDGSSEAVYDFSSGFVVRAEDTERFLKETLAYMGLIPREYNEFIVYWLPKMIDHPYYLISFQQEAYTEHAALEITPEPDSLLRVFMAFQPLEQAIDLPEQELEPFQRAGFTVVEWGGSRVAGGP